MSDHECRYCGTNLAEGEEHYCDEATIVFARERGKLIVPVYSTTGFGTRYDAVRFWAVDPDDGTRESLADYFAEEFGGNDPAGDWAMFDREITRLVGLYCEGGTDGRG